MDSSVHQNMFYESIAVIPAIFIVIVFTFVGYRRRKRHQQRKRELEQTFRSDKKD